MLKSALWAAALVAGSIAPVFAQTASPVTPGAPAQQAPGTPSDPNQQRPPEQPLPNAQSAVPNTTQSTMPKQQGEIQELPPTGTPSSRRAQQAPDAQQSRDRYAGSGGYSDGRSKEDDRFEPRWSRREGRRYGWEGRHEPGRWHRRFEERQGYMQGGMPPQRFGFARLCGADPARVAQSLAAAVERVTHPAADQRDAFEKLRDALGNAANIMRDACAGARSVTPVGKLASAEKRLSAMLEAVRTVRPAMEAYYNALSDEQKMRLTLAQRRMQGGGMAGRRDEHPPRQSRQMRDDDESDYTGSLADDDDDDDSED
jgi:hypothetical protein